MRKFRNSIVLAVVALLLIIHFFIGNDTINRCSPTFDETIHVVGGYSYLKTGIYYINIYDHPPVAEMYAALPLIFMKPNLLTTHPYWIDYEQYPFADIFLYHNRVDADRLLNTARIMILILSCFLGFIIYLWSRRLYGVSSGIFALLLYVLSSSFIAHGTLVTTDLAITCFYFLCIYVFWSWLDNRQMKTIVLLSLITVLTLTTKFSGIIIMGMYSLLLASMSTKGKIKLTEKRFLKEFFFFVVLTVVFILVVYKFKYIGLYFEGLKITLARAKGGHSAFFMGEHSNTGWIHYFLVTFLIKTPVPLLVLIVVCLICNRKKIFENNNIILLLPAVVYFVIASLSKKQIGHRYILPIYPFLFVWVSGIIPEIKKVRIPKAFWLVVCSFCFLVVWYIYSCINIHPWHISYFNEFIGKPENGYKYLTDSNTDWGQGLKELGKWYKNEELKGIFLSYFGTADPHYYGIKYIPVGITITTSAMSPEERAGDNIIFSSDDRIVFAISVTNLQATYYANRKIFDWLRQHEPDKIIAYSIFIYDLTNKPILLKQFADFLRHIGKSGSLNFLYSGRNQEN